MPPSISYLADEKSDSNSWSVEQMLASALSDIQKGERAATKAIVLFLDDSDEQYNVGFNQSGFRMSEAIALIEVAKITFLREMGHLE